MDNFWFTDYLKFDKKQFKNKTNTPFPPIFFEKKNSKLLQSSIRGNNIRFGEKKLNLSFIDNNNIIKLAFILIFDSIDFLSKQSTSNHIEQVLYPSQIVYNFRLLLKIGIKVFETY